MSRLPNEINFFTGEEGWPLADWHHILQHKNFSYSSISCFQAQFTDDYNWIIIFLVIFINFLRFKAYIFEFAWHQRAHHVRLIILLTLCVGQTSLNTESVRSTKTSAKISNITPPPILSPVELMSAKLTSIDFRFVSSSKSPSFLIHFSYKSHVMSSVHT